MERAMRRSFCTTTGIFRPTLFAILLLGPLAVSSASAQSQVRFLPETAGESPVAQVLDQCQTLESQRRWGEALSYYEEALRANPNQPALEARMELARLHFDLAR